MNLSTEKKIMDMENRLVVANEILLYSTGNYVWSLVMENDNGKKRKHTCICDWVTSLCSRKLTKHCKSSIMEK